MIKMIFFCLSVCCMLMPFAAQAAGIAVISHVNIKPYQLAMEGFREQMDRPVHAYDLGKKYEQGDSVAKLIYQQQPVLIFALGKSALNFARGLQLDIPIVFVFVLHPNKHVITPQGQAGEFGIAMSIPPEQQFNMLLNLVPNIKRIGVVYDPQKSRTLLQQAKLAAQKLGVKLISMPARNQKDAAYAIAHVMLKVDAMWMIPDTTTLTSTTLKQMMRLSLQYTVPFIGLAPKYVRAGSLFALSFESRAIGVQAGDIAKKILNGEEMQNQVPPHVVNFVLNQKTADSLGLDIPTALLKQAKHLYPEHHGESQ